MNKLSYIITVILITIGNLSSSAQGVGLDSLYSVLDEAINHSQQYVQARMERTNALQVKLAAAKGTENEYHLNMQLFEEYRSVNSDSAFMYVDSAFRVAREAGNYQHMAYCVAEKAFLCATVGMYAEGLDLLKKVDTTRISGETLGRYALAAQHVYGELAFYSSISLRKDDYQQKADSYMPLLLDNLAENDDDRLLRLEMDYYGRGEGQKALEVNDRRMSQVHKDSREMAVISFYRFLDLRQMGDTLEAKRWLVQAAINDVRHGVMDQGAMWELANLLCSTNQVERAYKYITFTWDCAQQFGTRVRSWQFSPILSTIDARYREKTEEANHRLRLLVVLVSLLTVMVASVAVYTYRQRRKLALAKVKLDERNESLASLNGKLSMSNDQLMELNQQLQEMVKQLDDSSRAKEEYIGRFFTLCSTYVDRMEKLRVKVSKAARGREYAEIVKLTDDGKAKDKDLAELYQNFDTTFLKLYPHFVEQFNAMLQPEHRIEIQEGKLSTTLRIFALIRLGIEDSGKIAEFLHYSVNTIYNYRARLKNAALADREHFEERIKALR